MISVEDIKHIAALSKLKLSDDEVVKFQKDIGEIVEYVNTLSQIDTSSVELTEQVVNVENLRADEVAPSLSQSEALENAPKKRNGGFSVPAVIE